MQDERALQPRRDRFRVQRRSMTNVIEDRVAVQPHDSACARDVEVAARPPWLASVDEARAPDSRCPMRSLVPRAPLVDPRGDDRAGQTRPPRVDLDDYVDEPAMISGGRCAGRSRARQHARRAGPARHRRTGPTPAL